MGKQTILLGYDTEEFDLPLEFKGSLPFNEQIDVCTNGLHQLLAVLNKYHVKATFYTTARYALAKPELIKSLHNAGHEIASHAYCHSQFEEADLQKSKTVLEEIIQAKVYGFRMPRMMPVSAKALLDAGYTYNSSINPTWMPGRYNHLKASRILYKENGLWQLPASVTPTFRIPLFWLAFHNFPFAFYWQCCKNALAKDGYANLYFHPWEFVDYRNIGNATYPAYITRNCGAPLLQRTELLIKKALAKGYVFDTTINWLG